MIQTVTYLLNTSTVDSRTTTREVEHVGKRQSGRSPCYHLHL